MRALSFTTDSLSPMLVKELRQGVKSKSFFFAFLLMQLLTVWCALMYLTASATHNAASAYDGMFWTCLGVPLIFITPLRALMGGVYQELKGNTLELIFLTRLSAWRIIIGKWWSLYVQSLLMASAVLPYLIFRYFMGGIDIVSDLEILFFLLLASALCTAAGIALSTFRSMFFRVIILIGAFISPVPILSLIAALTAARMMGAGGSSPFGFVAHPFWMTLLVILYALLGIFLCLAGGTSRIAPPAENISRWKRLALLALLALLPAFAWAAGTKEYCYCGVFFIVFICCDALCEAPNAIPNAYAAFAKRGALARLLGFFFYPGWPSGIFFTLLACGVWEGMIACFARPSGSGSSGDEFVRVWGMAASLPGALIFPLGCIALFRPKVKNLPAAYLGIQIGGMVLVLIAASLSAAFGGSNDSALGILSAIPTSALLAYATGLIKIEWLSVTGLVSVAFLVLVVRLAPQFRLMRDTARAAASRDQKSEVSGQRSETQHPESGI